MDIDLDLGLPWRQDCMTTRDVVVKGPWSVVRAMLRAPKYTAYSSLVHLLPRPLPTTCVTQLEFHNICCPLQSRSASSRALEMAL